MPQRGCITCRDRKVLCDRTLPACMRCARSGRECHGYGTRLSWPRDGDTRRTIIGPAPAGRHRNAARHFINTSAWDLEIYDLLSGAGSNHDTIAKRSKRWLVAKGLENWPAESLPATQLAPSPSVSWASGRLDHVQGGLFEYFVYQASFSLMAFGHDAMDIRDILVRMALFDDTPSATAILKSALALSSYHRYREHSLAAQLKIAALRALAESTRGHIGVDESIRHVAAGMLLCTLEIHQISASSSHWLWYVCGSKKIIKSTRLDETAQNNDFTTLIGWVHYYDVLARFSLRHWRPNITSTRELATGVHFEAFQPAVCAEAQPEHLVGPSHEILYLLSNVCDTVVEASDPRCQTSDYRQYIKILEWKLRKVNISENYNNNLNERNPPSPAMTVELYQLATLIYLRRASTGIPQGGPYLKGWIERAFDLLSGLEACPWPFPLLILGCEAQTEAQRTTVLDLITKTEMEAQLRKLGNIKAMIQRVWVQDDLLDEEFNYVHKLGIVLSSANRAVPALV